MCLFPQSGADFEVVNVLDDVYNPGLREAIKNYSAWPTIPQVGAAPCPPPQRLGWRQLSSGGAWLGGGWLG